MTPSSSPPCENASKQSVRARKWLQLILQELAARGGAPVADEMGVSISTVSRLKDHLPNACALLDTLGLKVVPQQMKCYQPQDIDPLLHFAKRYMASLESADNLVWEEAQ